MSTTHSSPSAQMLRGEANRHIALAHHMLYHSTSIQNRELREYVAAGHVADAVQLLAEARAKVTA